jgi:hypothetical protein
MSPPSEAGLILAHYLKHIALHAGLKWTEANAADMRRLSALLASPVEDQDTIPPYCQDRATVVLEREPAGAEADPQYQEWRRQQYAGDADAAVRRMVSRNGGGR